MSGETIWNHRLNHFLPVIGEAVGVELLGDGGILGFLFLVLVQHPFQGAAVEQCDECLPDRGLLVASAPILDALHIAVILVDRWAAGLHASSRPIGNSIG